MTWSRVTTTGSGTVAWRVSIEGSPYEPVSHKDMETTTSGRTRYVGLSSRGFKFSERVDMVRGILEADGLRIKIADVATRWTQLFAKRPTLVSHLTANLAAGATSMTVTHTTGWPDSGYLHLDRETIAYGSKDATHFLDLTRAQWDTEDVAHYTADGENQRFPEVTNHPVLWDGRRVRVYAYGAGDSATGNGTQVWQGVVSRSPNYNGLQWSFMVDPITRVLDASLGNDIKDPCPIRGIYYPASSPLLIKIGEWDDDGPSPNTMVAQTSFAIAGFWETQAAFVATLNTHIPTFIADPLFGSFTQTDVVAIENGESWGFRYETDGATPRLMTFETFSAVDLFIGHKDVETGLDTGGAEVTTATAYVAYQASGFGVVPRATIGYYSFVTEVYQGVDTLSEDRKIDVDATTYPPWRVYLGGTATVTSSTSAIAADWKSNGNFAESAGQEPFTSPVLAVDTSSRSVEFTRPRTFGGPNGISWYAAVGYSPQIRQGRSYGIGTLADFLTAIIAQTTDYVNTGAVPDLRATDIDTVNHEIAAAVEGLAAAQNRHYTFFADVSVKDLIEQECRLAGVYPCINSSGQITFKRLRLPAQSEVASSTLTSSEILVGDQWISYEPNALGTFNTVVLRTGYDPIEDDHKGTTWKVRDVAAYGQSPNARTLEIAPLSLDPHGGVYFSDILTLGARTLGVFAGPYAFATFDVPLTRFSTLLGSAISITYGKMPENDGTLGVSEKIGLVVGREWEPMDAMGRLTVLVTDQRIGGYVPSAKVSAISGASGSTGPFTVTLTTSGYFKSGTDPRAFWTAGDKIRLVRWDATATANNQTASLTSVSATQLVFTTDGNWTHAGATWMVGSQVSTAITADGQKIFVYVGNTDGTLDFSGDTGNPVFAFAP